MKILDIFLLRIAKWILMERNVSRAMHISRRDNNKLWYAGESIGRIIQRMKDNYSE